MIEEILPGLAWWPAFHEGIGRVVYSSFVLDSGTLIDPMEPEEGVEAIAALGTPQRIVLSNRHHYRDSARFSERFGCPVLCHEAALQSFAPHQSLRRFCFDEQLAPDVRALELAVICAEETTLLIELAGGVLSFGDGLTRAADGSLAFMRDELLGDDPAGIRAGLHKNLKRMLEEDFDALLFAHAEPVLSGGRALLDRFASREASLQAM